MLTYFKENLKVKVVKAKQNGNYCQQSDITGINSNIVEYLMVAIALRKYFSIQRNFVMLKLIIKTIFDFL